jgi:AAA+ ATPase superfamily predicted ATPase
MQSFIGRARELSFLASAFQSEKSELIPIYGRRRVGKTTLIAESLARQLRARAKKSLFYTGRRLTRDQQIKSFLEQAALASGDSLLAEVTITDWSKALQLTEERMRREGKKTILVFDEFQWMVEQSPELLSELQQLWDHHWQPAGNVVVIVCGSYVGFMEREVLGKKSPLFGRRTGSIRLGPLTASDARALHPRLSLEDAARVYFICGGVPSYHLTFSQRRSFQQNIAEAFFGMGPLSQEPSFLLREELREVATYSGVLTALAAGRSTRKDLAAALGVSESNMSFYLNQLVELGYVRRRYPLSGRRPSSRQVRFVLADPLLRFWFRFIERASSFAAVTGAAQAVQSQIVPQLDSYLGGCFEQLCRDALPALYVKEGVTAAFEVGEFWSKEVQIDVVGLREDGVADIGECKWGKIPSRSALEASVAKKMQAYPNHQNASLVGRAFVRKLPRGLRAEQSPLLWHSLDDLY